MFGKSSQTITNPMCNTLKCTKVFRKRQLDSFYANCELTDNGIPEKVFRNLLIPNYDNVVRVGYEQIDSTVLLLISYINMPYTKYAMIFTIIDDKLTLCEQMVVSSSAINRDIELLPKNHYVLTDIEEGIFIFQYKNGAFFNLYPKLDIYEVVNLHLNDLVIISICYDSLPECDDNDDCGKGVNRYIAQLQNCRLPIIRYDERDDRDISPIIKTNKTAAYIRINENVLLLKQLPNSTLYALHVMRVLPDGSLAFYLVLDENLLCLYDVEDAYPGLVMPKLDITVPVTNVYTTNGVIINESDIKTIICETSTGAAYELVYRENTKEVRAREIVL